MRRCSRASSKLAKARSRKAEMPKRRVAAKAVSRHRSSAPSQETKAARLARELSAMSEILRLISNSLSNVTAAVAEQAAQICQAQYVDIFIVENDSLRNLAWFGEIKRTLAFPLDRSTVAGRSVCDMRPISVD